MTRRSSSIAARAAWAAFASAAIAAAVAAIASSALADFLVVRQTDRHLAAVATELARELDGASDARSVARVVDDEQREVTSTGLRLAVYGAGEAPLAGDANVPRVDAGACVSARGLRVCGVRAGDARVVAGTLRQTSYGSLALAAAAAAALAGGVAWILARRLSHRAVEPLARLQTRIASLSLETTHPVALAELGADEGIAEVDALRGALEALLARMHDALERSSQFAASAAHELRTPLTSLRAELELLAEGARAPDEGPDAAEGDAASARALGVALRKVAQLQALTERLLVLATPSGGGSQHEELVSLRDVLDEALTALPADDLARIAVSEGDADAVVRGDALALGMAVSNGLSNALKYGDRVRLELDQASDRGIVAIEDDGPGVPESERARVFAPFARGGGASGVPGHGLGLALVAHVVKRHGGRARLTAPRHSPRGARLELELPLAGKRDEPARPM